MDTSKPAVIEATPARKALPSGKRQHRSLEIKRKIVEETLAPGASVARVARAHGVNANQVFQWRRLYRAGRLGALPLNVRRSGKGRHRVTDHRRGLRAIERS